MFTRSLHANAVVANGYSCTVMLNEHVAMLPATSVNLNEFVVVPIANSAPDGRPAVCITGATVVPAWYTTAPLNTLGENPVVHGVLLVEPAFNVSVPSVYVWLDPLPLV